jgi:hypothetical protein
MRLNDPGDGAGMARTLSRRNWLTSVWGNELARDVDRWQAGVRLVLVALFVVMVPLAAVIGWMVAADDLHKGQSQSQDRTATTAVLTTAAPPMVFTASGVPVLGTTAVPAEWSAPDGSTRVGHVPSQAGSVVGTRVDIWVDSTGALVDAPLSSTGSVVTGLLVGVGMLTVWGLLLAGGMRFCANVFDRGRRSKWERDWDRVAPLWLRQQ